jgi:glycerophosphoryl diester phosphodiesterase
MAVMVPTAIDGHGTTGEHRIQTGRLDAMDRTPLGPAPLIYAHRGDRSRAADNTIEAYALAVEAGSDGIELDVRQTVDGALIVVHDAVHGDLPPFALMTLEAVRRDEPRIPTLAEALAAIPRSTFVNVEIKHAPHERGFAPDRRIVDATLAEIATVDETSRILISSFDPAVVARTAEIAPDMLRGLLIPGPVDIREGIAIAADVGAHALHPPMSSFDADIVAGVDEIHDGRLAVVVWNANTPTAVSAAAAAGVDVIITDDPGMARSALAAG